MASKMRTMHTIPADFPQILKDFTREILRNQPQNIYQFGKEYFAARIREESPNESINNEYLVQYLTDLFIQADTNQNGRLDKKEFKELMFRADLGLSKDDIKLIFMEADVDDSGSLEYEEFIPLMMHVIESIKEVEHAKEEENFVREQAEEIAEEYMLRGITSQELEKYLRASFMEADRDSSGQLDAKEFKTFLMNCPINLTKKEINAIYMEVDTDQNGLISLEEFIPVFHSLMFQLTTNEALRLIRQQDLQELPQILIGCCSKYDPEGTGLLHPKQIAKAIRDADLGLSRFQIFQLVGQCNREEDGVKYVPFIEGVAAPLIAKLVDIDLELAYKRAVRVEEQVDYAGKQAEELLGMPQEVFEKILYEVFVTHDIDGSGYLEPLEFEAAISSSGLNLTESETIMLLLAADENEDGKISYGEFATVALEMLLWARSNALEQSAESLSSTTGGVAVDRIDE